MVPLLPFHYTIPLSIPQGHTADLLEQEKVLKEMHATELKEALDKAVKEHEKSLELTRAEGERVLQLSLLELKRRLDEVPYRVNCVISMSLAFVLMLILNW